jgi:Fic family protein
MSLYDDVYALWRSWNVQTQADISLRLDNFRILFAYNSGKIENDVITYSDTREVFENGRVLNYTGHPRTLFELSNQKLCYEYLMPKFAVREPLSIALVKETHAVLTAGTYDERRFVEQGERPGEFKKHDYVTGVEEVGSLPEDVEKDLTELINELNDGKTTDILIAAAYFHARFEYIHPFADGNGRVGRALLNFYLMTHGHPPLIIFSDEKSAYYDALHAYDVSEDLQPMIEFLRGQTERTWKKSLWRESRNP